MDISEKLYNSTINIISPCNLQDQDSPGGKFSAPQSFLGMMADIHMWDYVISASEIQNYNQEYIRFERGNVFRWDMLDFKATGRVLIEDRIQIFQANPSMPIQAQNQNKTIDTRKK